MESLSFFKYTFEVLGISQFGDSEMAMQLFAFKEADYMTDIYWLIALCFIFRLLSYVCLYWRARVNTSI